MSRPADGVGSQGAPQEVPEQRSDVPTEVPGQKMLRNTLAPTPPHSMSVPGGILQNLVWGAQNLAAHSQASA